ncbi:MAG: hypothetical protein HY508_11105 [Acidobacteria bacterium]|nr:hypothetical protein [Acidobacteriota bacterium]
MHDTGDQPRYETRDVASRSMVWSAIGILMLTVAGLAASWIVMKYFVTVQRLGPPASPFDQTRTIPPAPRLSVRPVEELKRNLEEEKARLSSYGWIDQNAGTVHIPIERAMELSLEKGFPVRPSPVAQSGAGAQAKMNLPTPKKQQP